MKQLYVCKICYVKKKSLQSKSMDWFLYDNGLRHERVKYFTLTQHIENQAMKESFCLMDLTELVSYAQMNILIIYPSINIFHLRGLKKWCIILEGFGIRGKIGMR